ncbi:TPA: hypothetical protein DCW38_03405 [candidate division WOR-3 bacterium]|uniref:Uncharacterized protein n=1 Tax=candidate division WOR-3 bacterium TaxID=2052148 RepID=A0A350H9J3_UNCW3|nr:hypothetical protein [candidate division WOR-3 bacterium]
MKAKDKKRLLKIIGKDFIEETLSDVSLETVLKSTITAFHLLISFKMKKSKEKYYCLRYKVIYLVKLPLKLKLEFNANNKTLYSDKTDLLAEGGFRRQSSCSNKKCLKK